MYIDLQDKIINEMTILQNMTKFKNLLNTGSQYTYHNSGHYPSTHLLFITQFRDRILSQSSGGPYSVGPNRQC